MIKFFVLTFVDENHKSFGETRIDKISKHRFYQNRLLSFDRVHFLISYFTMVFGINLRLEGLNFILFSFEERNFRLK